MTYKVTGVGQAGGANGPHEWKGAHGVMVDYKIKLEGLGEIVTLTRKQGSKPPEVGEELDGTIDMSGSYGPKLKVDFAAARAAQGASNGFKGQPRDDDAIRAQWAIGQAVSVHGDDLDKVEPLAGQFFAMVSRVKHSDDAIGQIDTVFNDVPPEDVNLDDLPEDF